jgi:hypothetical protein
MGVLCGIGRTVAERNSLTVESEGEAAETAEASAGLGMDMFTFLVTFPQQWRHLMATLDDVKQAISDLQTAAQSVDDGLNRVATEIQALKDQIASGGGVTAADLDGLVVSIQAVKTTLSEALTKESGL